MSHALLFVLKQPCLPEAAAAAAATAAIVAFGVYLNSARAYPRLRMCLSHSLNPSLHF